MHSSNFKIYFDTYRSGQRRALVSLTTINMNWCYLATTRNNESGRIYFEDFLDVSGLVVNSIDDSLYNLNIGRTPMTGSYYFNGLIPTVKIYDRVLTEEEISGFYNITKKVFNWSLLFTKTKVNL